LLVILLLITYLSTRINPSQAWILAFIALAYPFILVLNIAFVFLWIIFRKWYFLVSLITILIGWNALKSSIQINYKNPEKNIKVPGLIVVTYNVRLFNYYQWDKDTTTWQKIIRFVKDQRPDVVCFQEFITIPGSDHDLDNLKKVMEPLHYSHVYYTDHVPGKINFGLATFSRYPIIHKEPISFPKTINGAISSDILIGKDTIRIYNCHLQSIRLRKDYNDLLDSLIFNYSERQLDELKDISVRMRQAYILRGNQVDLMNDHIRSSVHPVILCGDFNDTPVSYTYYNLSKGLKDAYIESGSGIGTTFRGNLPYMRIDYVLYSPWFTSKYYGIKRVNLSDHYPVVSRFELPAGDTLKPGN
jgi:endonuclease/exonuclease/phosphatase family metal-dependent hydrolase